MQITLSGQTLTGEQFVIVPPKNSKHTYIKKEKKLPAACYKIQNQSAKVVKKGMKWQTHLFITPAEQIWQVQREVGG